MSARPPLRERTLMLILVLVVVPCLFIAPFTRGLWHTDEVRYVEAARQMDIAGDWIVPRLNGELYPEKPPFFFWSIMLFERITGDYARAGQLVVLLAMLGSCALVVRLGRVMFDDPRPGLAGALVLATTTMTITHGQRPVIDPMLVLWTLAGTVALVESRDGSRGRRATAGALAVLALTCGCLTKGPVALLSPVAGAAFLGAAHGGWRGIPRVAPLVSAAVAAIVTLIWLRVASDRVGLADPERGADWLWNRMLVDQILGRTVRSWAHREPWTFFLERMPPLLLPWLALLPGAVALARRRGGLDASSRRALRALLAWPLFGLIFFSSISGKRTGYLFPFLPGLALALGFAFCAADRETVPRRVGRLSAWGLNAAWWALAAAGPLLAAVPWLLPAAIARVSSPDDLHLQWILDELTPWRRALLGGLGTSLPLAFALLRRRGLHATCELRGVSLAAAVALISGTVHLTLIPGIDHFRSHLDFAEALQAELGADERVLYVGSIFEAELAYYSGRDRIPLIEREQLAAELDRPGRLTVVLRDRLWETLPAEQQGRLDIVFGPDLADGRFYLARERPRSRSSGR